MGDKTGFLRLGHIIIVFEVLSETFAKIIFTFKSFCFHVLLVKVYQSLIYPHIKNLIMGFSLFCSFFDLHSTFHSVTYI